MKAYIAAPLFCDAEKAFNLLVDAAVRDLGLDTFLPQRDGGEAAPLVRQGLDEDTIRRRLYELDCAAIAECGVFVFILDGGIAGSINELTALLRAHLGTLAPAS